jgi:lactate dehydrogenase-like 2-hydroxyacid dehydrogenase
LGLTFEKDALINWLSNDKTSFAILDGNGARDHFTELNGMENVIAFEQYSGMTTEAKQRLSEKVMNNLIGFLDEQ